MTANYMKEDLVTIMTKVTINSLCHSSFSFSSLSPGEPGGGPRLRVKLLSAGAQQQEADPLHLLHPRQQAVPKAKIKLSPCLKLLFLY